MHRRFFPDVVKDELDEDVAADAPAVGAPADRPTAPWRLPGYRGLHTPTAASSSTDHHIAADEYDTVDDDDFKGLLMATEVPPVPLIEIPPEIREIMALADQWFTDGPEGAGSIPRTRRMARGSRSRSQTRQARQTIDAGQTAVDPPTAAGSPHVSTQTYPARHVGTQISRPQMVIPMPALVPIRQQPPWRLAQSPIISTNLAQPEQVNCQGPSFVSTLRITSTRKRAPARSNSEKPSSCHIESVEKYVLECITSSMTHKHVLHKS